MVMPTPNSITCPLLIDEEGIKCPFSKDAEGNWITDHDSHVNYTSRYFQNIYTTCHSNTDWKNIQITLASFYSIDLSPLDNPLLDQEVT